MYTVVLYVYVKEALFFLIFACCSSAAKCFFSTLSAAGQARHPAVRYDARLDPGRAPRWCYEHSISLSRSFLKVFRSASLRRVSAMENPIFFFKYFSIARSALPLVQLFLTFLLSAPTQLHIRQSAATAAHLSSTIHMTSSVVHLALNT